MNKQIIKFKPRESWIARGKDGLVRMYKHYPTEENKGTFTLSEEQVKQLDIEITEKPIKCYWHRAIEIKTDLDITTL